MLRILLVSNSTQHGQRYLEHCAAEVAQHFGGGGSGTEVLFIPFALADHDAYAATARTAFEAMGLRLRSLHEVDNPRNAIDRAAGFFTGGGNTFRLLRTLQDGGLIEPIRQRVRAGAPYLGTSAGSNIACPSIRTTNDMPIVEPDSFDALGLVPFQLNPHYLDPAPDSQHMGETREQRIREFHEENDMPVLGLREGGMLRIEGARMTLLGPPALRLFQQGRQPVEYPSGADLSFLLGEVVQA
ncbi:MAG: dipeptidase PepE [Planctomycetota bacterium]